jgi:hypothetical protein
VATSERSPFLARLPKVRFGSEARFRTARRWGGDAEASDTPSAEASDIPCADASDRPSAEASDIPCADASDRPCVAVLSSVAPVMRWAGGAEASDRTLGWGGLRRGRGILGVMVLAASIGAGCGSPPPLGPDKEAFKTVDALYTAISLHDLDQLKRCQERLKALREAEKLPAPAFEALEAIITAANDGRWESSQERLAAFMEGQRR